MVHKTSGVGAPDSCLPKVWIGGTCTPAGTLYREFDIGDQDFGSSKTLINEETVSVLTRAHPGSVGVGQDAKFSVGPPGARPHEVGEHKLRDRLADLLTGLLIEPVPELWTATIE